MARCSDKTMRLAGLNLTTGAVFVVPTYGDIYDNHVVTLLSGRSFKGLPSTVQKRLTTDSSAPVLPAKAFESHVLHNSAPSVAFYFGAAFRVEIGGERFTATGSGPAVLRATFEDVASRNPSDMTSCLAATCLSNVHLKSASSPNRPRAASKIEVLGEYLPDGFVDAMQDAQGADGHLSRIRGERTFDSSLDKHRAQVSPERLERVRQIAKDGAVPRDVLEEVWDWRAAAAADPLAALLCPEAARELAPALWMGMYCNATSTPLVNLTPHAVSIIDESGFPQRTYLSAGVARAAQTNEAVGTINGVPVVRSTFGEAQGFPAHAFDPDDNTRFIVSAITAPAAIAAGIDPSKLLLTSQPVLDNDKRIIGARAFATPPTAAPTSRTREQLVIPTTANLVNLTPRDVVIADPNTLDTVLTIPASGQQATARQTNTPAGEVHGQPITTLTYGDVENIPAPLPGTFYVVSFIAAAAAPDRTDLLVTSGPVRNADGQIVASSALAVP